MGKPTGFLEYPRELPLVKHPAERIHSWSEFHEHSDVAMLAAVRKLRRLWRNAFLKINQKELLMLHSSLSFPLSTAWEKPA